jgi:hypothetical protein
MVNQLLDIKQQQQHLAEASNALTATLCCAPDVHDVQQQHNAFQLIHHCAASPIFSSCTKSSLLHVKPTNPHQISFPAAVFSCKVQSSQVQNSNKHASHESMMYASYAQPASFASILVCRHVPQIMC